MSERGIYPQTLALGVIIINNFCVLLKSPDTSLDDDGFICQICYEPFTNSGGHRVCCLKCGHIYGMECIEKWIVSSKRCPSCNCKAMKKDIRILYTKNLKVMDTTELDRVKAELEKANIAKNSSELRYEIKINSADLFI